MISREEIDNLAELSRLKLSDAEAGELQKDISNIVEYIGQVSAVAADTFNEKPLLRNVMREDFPRDSTDPLAHKEEALKAAFPSRKGDFNVVRKIIQKDE